MRVIAALVGLFAAAGCAQAVDPAAVPGAGSSLLQMVAGLLIVLACIAVLAWCARRFGIVKTGAHGSVRVVAGASVGPRERVAVVEIGGQWLVLGVATGSVNLLASLPAQPLPEATTPAPTLPPQFADWLKRALAARNKAG